MSRSSEGTSPGPVDAQGAADLRAYRRLFAAYVTALLGTGITVVGASLLAFDLTGEEAGVAIAVALSIKVFAYVAIAPLAEALMGRARRRRLLVALDLVRAATILSLYFVTALWQFYLAVLVFTAASAAFTPSYQALVPRLLPDPDDYARALAKSRAVSELEGGVSPAVAAALLLVLTLKGLFLAAVLAFLLSAAILLAGRLPDLPPAPRSSLWRRATLGPRLLAATPAFRGLAPLHLAAAIGSAMVMVNTVSWVQGDLQGQFGLGDRAAGLAFGLYGLGSAAGAVAAPAILGRFGERTAIFGGCALMIAALAAGLRLDGYGWLLGLWAAIGAGSTLALTPAPLLLARAPERRYAPLHAALFALGNAALLVAYPAAALLGWALKPDAALFLAACAAATATALAYRRWPPDEDADEATAPPPGPR